MPRFLTLFTILFISCSASFSQNNYESNLFECINDAFKKKGLDLDLSMDSLENQLYSIGYLSDELSLYDLFKYQSLEDVGPLMLDRRIKALDERTIFFETKTQCYNQLVEGRNASKVYQIGGSIKELENKMPSEIWGKMNSFLEKEDYKHPFFRLSTLITLQSWALVSKVNWYGGPDKIDTVWHSYYNKTVVEVQKGEINFRGEALELNDLKGKLTELLAKNPLNHFLEFKVSKNLTNREKRNINSTINSAYHSARQKIDPTLSEKTLWTDYLAVCPYRYVVNEF